MTKIQREIVATMVITTTKSTSIVKTRPLTSLELEALEAVLDWRSQAFNFDYQENSILVEEIKNHMKDHIKNLRKLF